MKGKVYRRQRKKSSYVSKGTGSSNQLRKRRPPKQLTQKQKLYRETKNQVDRTNKRLRNLERQGFQGTWASRRLLDKLNIRKLKGKKLLEEGKYGKKIQLSKDLNVTQLIAINQATKNFLKSKTSTSRGINETRESVIKSLQKTFGEFDDEVDYDMAEVLYSLFDETEFEDISQYSNASIVWTDIIDFMKKDIGELDLIDRLMTYGNVDYNHDKDLRDKVNNMIEYLKSKRK